MRPRMLILGLEREAGGACLAQAAARGIDVVAADLAEHLAVIGEFAGDHRPTGTCVLNYRDVADTVRIARELHSQEPLDGVFSYREFGLEAAAAIAEALKLPGNPLEVVRLTRNKWKLKEQLRSSGLPQPRSARCAGADDAVKAFRELPTGKWIIKPCSLSGSLGVRVVASEEEVRTAADAIATLGDQSGILLEELIEGDEFSVEGMVVDGRAQVFVITAKQLFDGPTFVERGHLQPAALDEADASAIRDAVTKALAAAGVRLGHFHVEVFRTRSGIIVGEVHTRVGGDWIDLLTEEVFGIEMYGLALDQLLGRLPDISHLKPVRAAGVRFLGVARGVVTAVQGIEQAVAMPGVVRVDVRATRGMQVGPPSSSYDRIGSVVVRGDTLDEVVRRLDDAESTIAVDVSPA